MKIPLEFSYSLVSNVSATCLSTVLKITAWYLFFLESKGFKGRNT
jgi:hypothetical protein